CSPSSRRIPLLPKWKGTRTFAAGAIKPRPMFCRELTVIRTRLRRGQRFVRYLGSAQKSPAEAGLRGVLQNLYCFGAGLAGVSGGVGAGALCGAGGLLLAVRTLSLLSGTTK